MGGRLQRCLGNQPPEIGAGEPLIDPLEEALLSGEAHVPETSSPLQGRVPALSPLSVRRVELPWARQEWVCFAAHDFLSSNEADELRKWALALDAWRTLRSNSSRPGSEAERRRHAYLLLDDSTLASTLWERLHSCAPREMRGGVAVGVNEHFTVSKYEEGDFFAPHRDVAASRCMETTFEQSELSMLLCLSGETGSGADRFISPSCKNGRRGQCNGPCRYCIDVRLSKGSLLVFSHKITHAQTQVKGREKVVLRGDIMYTVRRGRQQYLRSETVASVGRTSSSVSDRSLGPLKDSKGSSGCPAGAVRAPSTSG